MSNLQPSFELRHQLRKLKGRDLRGGTFTQWDVGTGRFRKPTVSPDPILNLYVARSNALRGPNQAERYGAIRQTVVSPVCLPRDRFAEPARLAA